MRPGIEDIGDTVKSGTRLINGIARPGTEHTGDIAAPGIEDITGIGGIVAKHNSDLSYRSTNRVGSFPSSFSGD